MHTAYKSDILPGVTLTCINTDKFKTGCLSINLISGLSRETAAMNALLPRVLRRGSAQYPDMERITAALDDSYGARVDTMIRKKGELHCAGLFIDFPDDRYLPPGESALDKTVALAGGLLLSPDLQEGGLLRSDYVASERSNLIDDIRAGINDKRGYCLDRLIEEMCAGEPYAINRLGGEGEALEITPESLTAHYKNLFANSRAEVFYCGSAEPQRVGSALCSALRGLSFCGGVTAPKTEIILHPAESSPRRFTEVLDIAQGKLAVGFRLGKAMEEPNYPALMILNAIYGGGASSKLFLNLREKLSLCYYASSFIDKHKGVMIAASGVDFSNIGSALSELLKQLDQVKCGDVSDAELQTARRTVITAVKSAYDRPGGLLELYFDSSIAAFPYDPERLCEKVEAVGLDDIVEAASGVETDSIYVLRGHYV